MITKLLQSIVLFVLLTCANVYGQQIGVNGIGDSLSSDCYAFTKKDDLIVGSFWTFDQFSFQDTIDILLQFNLDCQPDNGDGFTIAFQNIGPFAGNYSGRLGIGGLLPSIFIEVDIDQNLENQDPPFDHIAVMANGVLDHNSDQNIAGPVPLGESDMYDFNDCNNHTIRVLYLPQQKKLLVYIDCLLKLETMLPDRFTTELNQFHWGGTIGMGLSNSEYNICINPTSVHGPIETIDPLCDTTVQLSAPFEASAYLWFDDKERSLFVRIIFFAGKGGTGKTSIAAATGIRAAEMGKKTVIMSLDVAHSLGDIFDLEKNLKSFIRK